MMSEYPPVKNYEIREDDFARVDSVIKLIEISLRHNSFTDPVEKAFLEAVLPHLTNVGIVRPHLAAVFAYKRQAGAFFPNGYALRALEFAVDKQMRQIFSADDYPSPYGAEYPAFFATDAWWHYREAFYQLDYDEIHEDMHESLQSNMHNAYAIYHLLTPAFKDRYGDDPIVLDNGASLGLGLKKWLSQSEQFDPIQVVNPPGRGQPIVPGEMEPDDEAQEMVDFLTYQDPSVKRALAYDATTINTDHVPTVQRIFSHTFPMSESLRRPLEVQEFERLVRLEVPNLISIRDVVDAADELMLSKLEDYLPAEGADAGIYSAVFFQNEPDKIHKILENTDPYLKPGAPRFISDFARPDPAAANGLKFIRGDWWHRPGSFAVFVLDNGLPFEVARFTTRRAEEMWLTDSGRQLLRRAIDLA